MATERPTVEKAVAETFSIGLIYIDPDLKTGETITASTVAVTPTGLTLSAVTISTTTIASDTVSTVVSSGTAGVEYVVLFKVTTSGGNIYNNPNKDAIRVRVI
jgi:hypothetical protein